MTEPSTVECVSVVPQLAGDYCIDLAVHDTMLDASGAVVPIESVLDDEDFSGGEQAFHRMREVRRQVRAAAEAGGPVDRAFDGAVIDLRMPGWDGVKTAQALRTVEPELPIIIWSGGAPPALAGEARLLGLHAFLEKPCDPRELVRVVRSLDSRSPNR